MNNAAEYVIHVPVFEAPKPPKYICGGCGAGSNTAHFWVCFNFRSLDAAWLCPPCQQTWGEHIQSIQVRGL